MQEYDLRQKYPDEEINKIINKGLINDLWIIGQHTIAKFSSDQTQTSYEVEDLKLLSNYVKVPVIFDIQPQCIFMSYHLQQKVNWRLLTRELEKLHKNTSDMYGYHRQSFYGRTKLSNDWNPDWWNFFLTTRMEPLISKINRSDLIKMIRFICDHVSYMGSPSKPSLLHGDLWANNIIFDGKTTHFIDPVCYYGDPLLDFARYKNKYSSQIRCMFYKAYYQLDYDCFINETSLSEESLKPIFKWIISQSFPLNIKHLYYTDISQQSELIEIKQEQKGLIYFGCMNPPHQNHLNMLERVSKEKHLNLESITNKIICVAPDSYLIKKGIPPNKILQVDQRVKLLQSQQLNLIFVFIISHHITMDILHLAHPSVEWWVVTGSDALSKAFSLIPIKYGLISVPRNNFIISDEIKEKINLWIANSGKLIFASSSEETISSTSIRQDPDLWKKYTSLENIG